MIPPSTARAARIAEIRQLVDDAYSDHVSVTFKLRQGLGTLRIADLRWLLTELDRLGRVEAAAQKLLTDLTYDGELSDCCYGGSCVSGSVRERLQQALAEGQG